MIVNTHESIEFEEIRHFDKRIYDEETFDLYLNELFLEISAKQGGYNSISMKAFLKYVEKIPIFISKKLFLSWNVSRTGFLSLDEFTQPLKILKQGSYEEVAKLVFNVYDFDSDGSINTDDVKLLISYLPLKPLNQKREYKYQMESLDELRNVIAKTFGGERGNIDFKSFLEFVDKQANVFLLLVCYLYLSIPVFEKAMELYKVKRKKANTVHYSPDVQKRLRVKLEDLVAKPFSLCVGENGSDKMDIDDLPLKMEDKEGPEVITRSVNKRLTVSPTLFSPIDLLKERKVKNQPRNLLRSTGLDSTSRLSLSDKAKLLKMFGKKQIINEEAKEDSFQLNLKMSSKESSIANLKDTVKQSKLSSPLKSPKPSSPQKSPCTKGHIYSSPGKTSIRELCSPKKNSVKLMKSPLKSDIKEFLTTNKSPSKAVSSPDRIKNSISVIKSIVSEQSKDILDKYARDPVRKESLKDANSQLKIAGKDIITSPLKINFFKEQRQKIDESNVTLGCLGFKFQDKAQEAIDLSYISEDPNKTFNSINGSYFQETEFPEYLNTEEELKRSIVFEGSLYVLNTREISGIKVPELVPIHAVIIDKNIYFYKSCNEPREKYFKSCYLVGSFIKPCPSEVINNETFYSINVFLSNIDQNLKFYHKDFNFLNQWVANIRKAIDYRNIFDTYNLISTIGEGQYGKVTLAENKETKEHVAVKILDKKKASHDYFEQFKTEIDILKLSKHKSIVSYIDNFENSEFLFIVMEYVKGGTLNSYLKERNFKISEKGCASIVFQISDALNYLHKYGIIHRDLKPDNILIVDNTVDASHVKIKVNDFGFGKILGHYEVTNECKGTLAFLAPEIISNKPYNNSVDIWSLGVVIYNMLSGIYPFVGTTQDALCRSICQADLIFPNSFKNLSIDLLQLMYGCLVKQASLRITIEDIMENRWFKLVDPQNKSLEL